MSLVPSLGAHARRICDAKMEYFYPSDNMYFPRFALIESDWGGSGLHIGGIAGIGRFVFPAILVLVGPRKIGGLQ